MQFRGGMNELMRQAARMQRRVDQAKQQVKEREFTGLAAADKVKVIATGEGRLARVEIDAGLLEAEGLAFVCDAIVAATNSALTTAEKTVDEEVAKITGNVKMPTG